MTKPEHIDGFVQNCSNSIANVLSCTKPSICQILDSRKVTVGYDYSFDERDR